MEEKNWSNKFNAAVLMDLNGGSGNGYLYDWYVGGEEDDEEQR